MSSPVPLVSTPSKYSSKVTLISQPSSSSVPDIKPEPTSPALITFRRSTRNRASLNPSPTAGPSTVKRSSSPPLSTPRKRVKKEDEPLTPLSEIKDSPRASGSGSAKKVKIKPLPLVALEKPHPAPARWKEQYRLIERMRKGIVAPVDDM
jgi:endonuclease-3